VNTPGGQQLHLLAANTLDCSVLLLLLLLLLLPALLLMAMQSPQHHQWSGCRPSPGRLHQQQQQRRVA
jgi:hypothetical protein